MTDKRDEQSVLPHLETFSKAAELGNFTAAAKALGLTQGAVSQRIQALERQIGAELFQRTGRRVVPTAAGRALYGYAEKIFALHREARRAVTGRSEKAGAELLLAASSIPGEHLLPALLAEFRRRHPGIRVRAGGGDSQAVIAQVERGRVSLGLVGDRTDNPSLEFGKFASDTIVLAVPAADAWGRRKRVSLQQLRTRPLVIREVGSGLRHAFETALAAAGRSLADFPTVLELGSNEAVKQAVRCGMGVGVLSAFAVQADVEAGRLHAAEIGGIRSARDMFVVSDRRRVLPAPARLFLHFLRDWADPGAGD